MLFAGTLTGSLAAVALAAAPPPSPLVAAVRCVSDHLEAVATAAPDLPPRARPRAPPAPDDPRWVRARSYLSPAADAAALADPRAPLAAWAALGRDGSFLGYEITWVRRAPRGAAVVWSRERTVASPTAQPRTASCAYLVAALEGRWRIADKRCGRDFEDDEVAAALAPRPDAPDGRAGAGAAIGPPVTAAR